MLLTHLYHHQANLGVCTVSLSISYLLRLVQRLHTTGQIAKGAGINGITLLYEIYICSELII